MPSAATTEAQVCSLALAYVGHAQPLLSLTENSSAARACKTIYGPTRDALLESHNWKFAKRHQALALLSGVSRTAWAYCYALPADCLVPRSIWPGTRTPHRSDKIPFDWEAGDGTVAGPAILVTDHADAELEYTAQVETVALFSPGFVKALAWAIAVELCLVLPIKPQVAIAIEGKAKQALGAAKAGIDNSALKDAIVDSEYVTGR